MVLLECFTCSQWY